jgi:outer membrane protein TolC
VLSSYFEVDGQEYNLEELHARMNRNNHTLQNQYINQEILKKDVKLSKTSLYPTLNLSSGYTNPYTYNYADWDAFESYHNYRYYANLTLRWTLSSGGNVRRAIRNAKIQETIGNITTDELEHKLYNQLYNSYEQYNIRRELLNVAELGMKSARLNLTIAEEKFRTGSINSFNYRDIQLVYLNASIERLQAIYNVLDSQTEILRLTGGIIDEYGKM